MLCKHKQEILLSRGDLNLPHQSIEKLVLLQLELLNMIGSKYQWNQKMSYMVQRLKRSTRKQYEYAFVSLLSCNMNHLQQEYQ